MFLRSNLNNKTVGLKELIFRKKPLCIFLQLKDTSKEWYASNLASACSTTYVHTVKLLKELRKSELITVEPKGRMKKIKLTDKGLQLATSLSELMQKLEEEKPPQK